MKTYNERLNLIAEEMAKAYHAETRYLIGFNNCEWDTLLDWRQSQLIKQQIPYAAIALKHMAEAYAEGHEQGTAYPHIDINLTSLGLIPPQKP